jgi:hypothetical protein
MKPPGGRGHDFHGSSRSSLVLFEDANVCFQRRMRNVAIPISCTTVERSYEFKKILLTSKTCLSGSVTSCHVCVALSSRGRDLGISHAVSNSREGPVSCSSSSHSIHIDGVSREGRGMCGIAWRLGPLSSHGVVRPRFAKLEGQKRSSGTPDV